MARKPDYSVPALERGFDVLEALAAERRPLTLTDIARRTRYSANALFRIADCLMKRGYLQRDPVSGAFRLSLRLYELAHTHSPVEELVRSALPVMDDLVTHLGESCHLSVLDGGDLLIVAQAQANRPVRLSIEVGSRFDAAATASGRLLVAHLEPAARASWAKRRSPKSPLPDPAVLESLRRDGFCAAYEETVRGVADVVVPIMGEATGCIAALAVSVLSPSDPKTFTQKALPALRKSATAIERQSGLQPKAS